MEDKTPPSQTGRLEASSQPAITPGRARTVAFREIQQVQSGGIHTVSARTDEPQAQPARAPKGPPPEPDWDKIQKFPITIGAKIYDSEHSGVTWHVGYRKTERSNKWQTVMVRVMKMSALQQGYHHLIKCEAKYLKQLRHKYILPCVYVTMSTPLSSFYFEFCKRNLTDEVALKGPIGERQVRIWMGQIAQAIN